MTPPVLLVAHPSPDVYGSDRQLLESIAGLRAAGWRAVVCLPSSGPLVPLLDECRVVVAPFPVLRRALLRPLALLGLLARSPRDLARLVRRLRAEKPAAVYVNTVTIPLWIIAARLCRIPVLVHVHEAEDDAPRLVRVALNAPLLLARVVVANSAASAAVLARAVPALRSRTRVVPNGVPDPGPADPEQSTPGRLVIVGRLSPRKGTDVALEAVAILREQGRDVRLEVCGTVFESYEWFERQLRDRADQPDLAGAVTFAGYVNPTTPRLARASVVLVPSRVEPFGNTAVEAQVAQRPLVASRVQGLAEIVEDGETGLLTPPGDAAALAAAVARFLDAPEWAREVAARARARALERFGLERYQRDMLAAVQALGPDADPVIAAR